MILILGIHSSGTHIHGESCYLLVHCYGLFKSGATPLSPGIDCVDTMKISLSSGHIQWLLWLAKGAAGNTWTLEEYANWRHTTHLCAGCGHKWDVAPTSPRLPSSYTWMLAKEIWIVAA